MDAVRGNAGGWARAGRTPRLLLAPTDAGSREEPSGLKVDFAAAEIFPFAKTGGLADVCAGLPNALAALGVDVRLTMPGYEQALDTAGRVETVGTLRGILGFDKARILEGRTPDSGLRIRFVDIPALYRNGGGLYVNDDGSERADSCARFMAFNLAVAKLSARNGASDWHPDIVHCNDWHTGLVPALLRDSPVGPATVFTIHNMAFQGVFPMSSLAPLGAPHAERLAADTEFYGKVSFLKAGLTFADWLTTVSPTYREEIQTPEYGCGLEGVLLARAGNLTGILNGIDPEFWSPENNPHIPYGYSDADLAGKRASKLALQEELGLDRDAAAPLMAFVCRLTAQKMGDVLRDCLPDMLARTPDLQFALLGQGDPQLEADFQRIAEAYPGRVSVRIGYAEDAAHRLHAGSDLLMHGSRFEPCGLTPLYAMRFGTIPIVRAVGGLADTVVHATERTLADGTANGFSFVEATSAAMVAAVDEAMALYRQPLRWRRLQKAAMRCDFSWQGPAQQYIQLYERLAAIPAAPLRRRRPQTVEAARLPSMTG